MKKNLQAHKNYRRFRTITVASLITGGNTEQLKFHLNKAKENDLSEEELKEVIIHLAFYAGWPKAMSAIMVAKELFSAGK